MAFEMTPSKQSVSNEAEKFTFKVENVVATGQVAIEGKIDLNIIARAFTDVEYNPERFPGLIMRVADPKATILLFSTGKMVITGMREETDAPAVVTQVIKRLKKCNIKVGAPEIVVQNIVASGDLKCNIDLNMAAVVMEYSMYEPEVFPGLIYRMSNPKTVFLLFSTGRIVCTGAKTKDMVAVAVGKLYDAVHEYGVSRKYGEISDSDLNLDLDSDENFL
jgi:transcription initiation factor TFIID TATA-box-binding protein